MVTVVLKLNVIYPLSAMCYCQMTVITCWTDSVNSNGNCRTGFIEMFLIEGNNNKQQVAENNATVSAR